MADETNEQEPESGLIIQFNAVGSTQFALQTIGTVTVGQLEALAHDLLAQAQYARYQQIHQAALAKVMEQQRPKIVVPTMQVKSS